MPMVSDRSMKWWGWGGPEKRLQIPAQALKRLQTLLDCELRPSPTIAYDEIKLPPLNLSDRALAEIKQVVGESGLITDRDSRILRSAGKSYPDLLKMRSGQIEHAPDAVAFPVSHEQVSELLKLCSKKKIAVIPFGGGTSVVGGVEPIRNGFDAALTLDLSRMCDLGRVDRDSLCAEFGPGMIGPQVESSLSAHGLTLGHFPQSYEYSTIGGWVATRSAGQASTGYGSIAKLTVGLKMATPAGDLEMPVFPATAAGPQLRELIVGSEGVLGVITKATLRLHKAPEKRRYEGWMFKSFSEGSDAMRKLAQEDAAPDVVRLSDESETEVAMLMAGDSLPKRVADRYIGIRGFKGGCIAIVGFEGEPATVHTRRRRAAKLMRSSGALYLGPAPGKSWLKSRFEGPYLRDELLSASIMAETLETATRWSNISDLYKSVKTAISDSLQSRGSPSIVMCHISHLYPIGASLYFTFICPQEQGSEFEQWQASKQAASDAIQKTGGTITHHHATGQDHRPWISEELGSNGIDILRSVKSTLDPVGVMNPGKLIPN